jgi:hypothetical protein
MGQHEIAVYPAMWLLKRWQNAEWAVLRSRVGPLNSPFVTISTGLSSNRVLVRCPVVLNLLTDCLWMGPVLG